MVSHRVHTTGMNQGGNADNVYSSLTEESFCQGLFCCGDKAEEHRVCAICAQQITSLLRKRGKEK